jgi:hypothetical protein
LNSANDKQKFKIYFMNGGRGLPKFDYKETREKILGEKYTQWNILYKNNVAFEAYINFPDNDFDNDLTSLYIYLPEDNQEQFIQTVEEIIATLEPGERQ